MKTDKKRVPPRQVSEDQLALAGVDLSKKEVSPQPAKNLGIPQRSRTRAYTAHGWGPSYRSSAFYGAIVPVPRDALGQELRLGPYAVLQKTTGEHFVMDYRTPLARGEIFTGTKRACVVEMVRLATK